MDAFNEVDEDVALLHAAVAITWCHASQLNWYRTCMCDSAHKISLQLDLDSGTIEALKQSPVQLQDIDPGLKHRAVGSGATSKAMALPLLSFTNIFA